MKIKIGFFAIMLILSLLLSDHNFALAAILSVIIHECGHIFAARLLKINMRECKIDIFGAALTPSSSDYTYKKEILLCLGGPSINIFSAVLVALFCNNIHNNFITYFIFSSIVLALLNMIPIKGFDGGRILFSVLCLILDIVKAERIIGLVSFVAIFLLWIISVYFLMIAKSNLSLFVFSASLFFKIFINKN